MLNNFLEPWSWLCPQYPCCFTGRASFRSTPEKSSLTYFQAFLLLTENVFYPKNTRQRNKKKNFFFDRRHGLIHNNHYENCHSSSSLGKLCSLKGKVKEWQGIYLATPALYNPPSSACKQSWGERIHKHIQKWAALAPQSPHLLPKSERASAANNLISKGNTTEDFYFYPRIVWFCF